MAARPGSPCSQSRSQGWAERALVGHRGDNTPIAQYALPYDIISFEHWGPIVETEQERSERHERERKESAERYEIERKESHERAARERKESRERATRERKEASERASRERKEESDRYARERKDRQRPQVP